MESLWARCSLDHLLELRVLWWQLSESCGQSLLVRFLWQMLPQYHWLCLIVGGRPGTAEEATAKAAKRTTFDAEITLLELRPGDCLIQIGLLL